MTSPSLNSCIPSVSDRYMCFLMCTASADSQSQMRI